MKIEKRYYDIDKERWDQIINEVQLEENQLTESEREARFRDRDLKLQEIYYECEERIRHHKKIIDREKVQQFQIIVQQALWMAEYIKANITVDTEAKFLGEIVLEAKDFIIPCTCNPSVKKVFCSLFLASDDIFIGHSSGLCRMQFLFDLYKEVSVD
ncbi:MAG: hypothetical protein ACI4DO_00390 [Roseburia sp.]